MIKALAWLCLSGIIAIVLVTRFSNPDMTETRLMIEFWPRWLMAVGLGGVAARFLSHRM